jgi:uncharacterized protein with PIN domain
MSRIPKFTLKDIEKELEIENKKRAIKIRHDHIHNHRLIPHAIYEQLKQIRKCQKCGREFKPYQRGEIHHVLAVRDGGKNNMKNLLLVCGYCHKILDEEQRKIG